MQLLSFLCLLCAGCGSFAVVRAPPEDGADTRIKVVPGTPSANQASYRFQNNYLAATNAGNERDAANDRSISSNSLESAARSELTVTRAKLEAEEDATLEYSKARKIELIGVQAHTVLESTQRLLDLIPEIARKAIDKAVNDVEQETFKKLNQELSQVVASASGSDAIAKHLAADAAQTAALPYQQGKMQAQQTMIAYAEKGQELATATAELKKRAVEIAEASVPLQRVGNVVQAQRLQMESRDVLDKAQQMEAQAKALSATALQIQRGLQAYDDAAQAAASYAAYQVNPAALDGDDEKPLPQPPFPLMLPKLAAAGPAGAPAPAPAGAAPAPGPPGAAGAPR